MRRILIWSVVTCLRAVLLTNGVRAQRTRPEAPTSRPSQVEVTNFPAVQGVSGTVNVGNLPAVQSVAGVLAVNNLPLDADGNVRVVAVPPGGPAYQLVKIIEGAQVPAGGGRYLAPPFPIAGWRKAFVFARVIS